MQKAQYLHMGDRDPQLRLHAGEARVALSVLIPVQLHRSLKVAAAERGTSVARLVSEVLAEALNEDNRPPSAA
jgi:hypothetical protein